MDLVITTALIPERPAPILISKEMVESMKAGSAIMDLAAINGGNCELTQLDKIINHRGVLIDGTSNIPSTMSFHASELYAKNIYNFIEHILNNEEKKLNKEEEITAGATLIDNGTIYIECNDGRYCNGWFHPCCNPNIILPKDNKDKKYICYGCKTL